MCVRARARVGERVSGGGGEHERERERETRMKWVQQVENVGGKWGEEGEVLSGLNTFGSSFITKAKMASCLVHSMACYGHGFQNVSDTIKWVFYFVFIIIAFFYINQYLIIRLLD